MKNIRRLQNLLEKSGLLPILQLRMNLRATRIDIPLGCIVICNDDTKIKLFDRQDIYKNGATIAGVGTINYLDVGFESDVLIALTEGFDCEWDSIENPNNNCPKKWAACATTNYECLLNLFIEHGGVSIEKTMLFNSSKIDKVHSKNGVYKLITAPSQWTTNEGYHMENCVYYANAEESLDNMVAVFDGDMIFSGKNNVLTKKDLLELESFYHIISPEMLPYIFGISYDEIKDKHPARLYLTHELAEVIKKAREEKGLSQIELSELTGISKLVIKAVEDGGFHLEYFEIISMESVLGIELT